MATTHLSKEEDLPQASIEAHSSYDGDRVSTADDSDNVQTTVTGDDALVKDGPIVNRGTSVKQAVAVYGVAFPELGLFLSHFDCTPGFEGIDIQQLTPEKLAVKIHILEKRGFCLVYQNEFESTAKTGLEMSQSGKGESAYFGGTLDFEDLTCFR